MREGGIESKKFEHVYAHDDKWYMRADRNSMGAEIPADIAKTVKLAMWLQHRIRNSLEFDENEKSYEIAKTINCHKTAFYALGLIDRKEAVEGKSALEASLFPENAYRKFDSDDQLGVFLREQLGAELGLVQIKGEDRIPTHSFLTSSDQKGAFICFEKESEDGDFRVAPLSKIFSEYKDYGWAAGVLDKLENPGEKIEARIKEGDIYP